MATAVGLRRLLPLLLSLGACSERESPPPGLDGTPPAISVAGPEAKTCVDVGARLVCWDCAGEGGRQDICVSERPLPAPATPSGRVWHCVGAGSARRCFDSARFAARFACDAKQCTQRHPLVPDDGEWECLEQAGAVVCAGGVAAAGIVPGGLHPAFRCGERRGQPDERVCVAFVVEYPDAGRYRCSYRDGARICVASSEVALLGDACERARPCVDGADCFEGTCVPPRPVAPHCLLDRDCAPGVCRFGACAAEGR